MFSDVWNLRDCGEVAATYTSLLDAKVQDCIVDTLCTGGLSMSLCCVQPPPPLNSVFHTFDMICALITLRIKACCAVGCTDALAVCKYSQANVCQALNA